MRDREKSTLRALQKTAGFALLAAASVGCSPSPAAPGGGTGAQGLGGSGAGGAGGLGGSAASGGYGGSSSSSAGGSGGSAGHTAGSGGTPEADWEAGFFELSAGLAPPFEIPPPEAGPGVLKVLEVSGLFADVDGDGLPEVILTHLFNDGVPHEDRKPTVYRETGGHLEMVGPLGADAFGAGGWFSLKALVDIDGDGHLDAISPSQVAWGLDNGEFEHPVFFTDANEDRGPISGMELTDIDSDGLIDILVGGGNCQQGSPALFPVLRTGLRSFAQHLDIITQLNHGRSFAVTAFPLDGSPVLGTLISDCLDGLGNPAPFYGWKGDHFASLQLLPPDYILVSPMGAAMADLDGDANLDLTISYHHDYFAGGTLPMTNVTDIVGFHNVPSTTSIPLIPWGVAFLDLDKDTLPDVVTVHGNDAKAWTDPNWHVGPQWTTVHRNLGGFKFEEKSANVRREGQWKALSVGDLDSDGDADIIVGGQGEMPGIFRNDFTGGNGVTIRLHGSTSNELGVGAIVDVWPESEGKMQRRLAGSAWSPGIISEPLVFVGLGSAGEAARVRITWPSGTVQEVEHLIAGKVHTIDEPPVVALEPKTRHAAADGASIVTVTVTPRNPDGTVKNGVVGVQVLGSGTAGAVIKSGDAWVCSVVAPSSPGSGTVQVTIDGTPVRVVPRIWWD